MRPPHDDLVVVICAHDAEGTLAAALASIAGQTRPPQHVVVVDDGSSDTTAEIARRWSRVLPLEVLTNGRNVGLGASRIRGVAASEAPLIAILDADDIWLPDHLETLMHAGAGRGALVTADALVWHPGSAVECTSLRRRQPVPNERQLLHLLTRNFVFIGSVMHRDDYAAVGGFRSFRDAGCEDWDLWIRLVRAGVRVVGAEHPTVLYRMSPTSMSARGLERAELAVLARADDEAVDDIERAVIRHTRRSVHARQALRHASVNSAGRRHALAAAALAIAAGSGELTARALGLAVAPTWSARLRRAVHRRRAGLR